MNNSANENDPRNMSDDQINEILERNGLGRLASTETDELTEILDAEIGLENAAWDDVTRAELTDTEAYEATRTKWENE